MGEAERIQDKRTGHGERHGANESRWTGPPLNSQSQLEAFLVVAMLLLCSPSLTVVRDVLLDGAR
jgi:hypothetical protein